MADRRFLHEYFERYRKSVLATDVDSQLIELKDLITATHTARCKTVIAGNGGSAAIAGHCAVDFTKNAGVRCVNFNEAGWSPASRTTMVMSAG